MSSRGMTLVEVLISMAVSLVVVLAIYQTFAASEGYRRTATSGGDATFDGTVALFTLQRDLRMSGFGVNTPGLLGCRVLAYDGGMDPPRDIEFLLAAANITQGAGTAPDTIEIVFSSSDAVPAPIRLTQATPTNTADLRIDNGFGIQSGHLMIVGEPGADCSLHQATNTPTLEPAGPAGQADARQRQLSDAHRDLGRLPATTGPADSAPTTRWRAWSFRSVLRRA